MRKDLFLMKTLCALCALCVLCRSANALSVSPPEHVTIEKSEAAGNGCPQDSLPHSARLADGGNAVELTLPPIDLAAATGGLRRLQCSVILSLKFTKGFSVRIAGLVGELSNASSTHGATVTFSTHLQGKEKTTRSEHPLINGPLTASVAGEWSPCGDHATFVTTTALRGRQDGALASERRLTLEWQTCP